jgi:hypothetical protein
VTIADKTNLIARARCTRGSTISALARGGAGGGPD